MNSLQNFREHFFSRRNSRPEFKGDTLQESELNALFVQQGGFKKWLIDKTKKVLRDFILFAMLYFQA